MAEVGSYEHWRKKKLDEIAQWHNEEGDELFLKRYHTDKARLAPGAPLSFIATLNLIEEYIMKQSGLSRNGSDRPHPDSSTAG